MHKTSITTTAKQKEYSLSRYAIRVKKDIRLHDDVDNYMTKHDTSLENLVDKLLVNHFPSSQQIYL